MFGLPSIQKLIVLAAVVAAVWYGFKFLGRLQAARKEEARLREKQGGRPARKAEAPKAEAKGGEVEDLVQCPSCGAYIQAGTTCDCGRKG
ncbi:hypothetical protein [Pelagibius marinus]|uniref:hypothetical protein n=1 Tax=Pelagibius marinus TaxID=2762760 RepID=UPI001872CDC8|nr:hypothetical protein [Pelagibius marinus]